MKHLLRHSLPAFFAIGALAIWSHAAPATVTLNGNAVASDSIRWSWTAASAGTTFTLLTSTNGLVATLSGTAGSYTEGGLTAGTAISRKLAQTDIVSTSTSALVTVATPDASVTVSLHSAGTLVATDQLTRVAVSAGAFPGSGQLSVSLDPINKPLTTASAALIAAAANRIPSGRSLVSSSLREFTALSNGDPYSSTLGAAASIQIPYSDSSNPGFVNGVTPAAPIQTLAFYTIDSSNSQWTAVPGATLDTTNKVMIANVSHFSIYALFASEGSADLSRLKVFPSPWRPGSGGAYDSAAGIHFQGLTPTATIKIFTIAGDIVRRIEKGVTDGNDVLWDGKNDDGKPVASGVYFYLVSDPATGQKAKDRFAVIR